MAIVEEGPTTHVINTSCLSFPQSVWPIDPPKSVDWFFSQYSPWISCILNF